LFVQEFGICLTDWTNGSPHLLFMIFMGLPHF